MTGFVATAVGNASVAFRASNTKTPSPQRPRLCFPNTADKRKPLPDGSKPTRQNSPNKPGYAPIKTRPTGHKRGGSISGREALRLQRHARSTAGTTHCDKVGAAVPQAIDARDGGTDYGSERPQPGG